MLCYQCAISGCIIRYGITVHITLIECMSWVCELISDDSYAVPICSRDMVLSVWKYGFAVITDTLTGISPWMWSRQPIEFCASVVLARQCTVRVVVGLASGVRCFWCLWQRHQKHLTPLANSTTTHTVHWRARTTDAQHSIGWRLHIHGLIPWSSYTVPDCTCLKLLMMGGCNTRNM